MRGTLWRPARRTVSSDSSWKAGGGGIRPGRRTESGERTGAGSGVGRGSPARRPARSAARRVGPSGSEMVTFFSFFFLMRALVTFEDHGPKSRGETGFFFPRWRILERRGAEAWGMRWPGRGDSNTGEPNRRRRRGRRVSGKLGGFLPAPHDRLDGGPG